MNIVLGTTSYKHRCCSVLHSLVFIYQQDYMECECYARLKKQRNQFNLLTLNYQQDYTN